MRFAGRALSVAFALVILTRAAVPAADDFIGKVVGVSDGDTITVLRDRTPVKVRLNAIDCPESGQDFGNRAKIATSELSFGKIVTVRLRGNDRYGRTVADVMLPDGQSLSYELVHLGFAWWYRRYAPNNTVLARLEAEARAAKIGLWSQSDPVPPWAWRKSPKPVLPLELVGKVVGNKRSRVYHKPGCLNGAHVSPLNRMVFGTEPDAERAGYLPGRDCH
jgi:endonuclease YncB( thermonuclease family)